MSGELTYAYSPRERTVRSESNEKSNEKSNES